MPSPFGRGHRYLGEFASAADVNSFLSGLGVSADAGMIYFDTTIGEDFRWNGDVNRWVSTQRYELGFGTRYRRRGGQYWFFMGDTATGGNVAAGIPVEECLLMGLMASKTTSDASTIEILREGSVVHTENLPSGTGIHEATFNYLLDVGRLAVRVQSGAADVRNSHLRLFYRRLS